MSALWPLQKALVSRLKGDAALMARVTGIHDGRVPTGAALPYVVIGEPTEEDRGTQAERGFENSITIHVWSSYAGNKEALEIGNLVDAALRLPLEIDGHTAAQLRLEFSTVILDDDGDRHMPLRYTTATFELA